MKINIKPVCYHGRSGITALLKNSGALVNIPDCVRLRSDDSNEVAGVTPDVLIPWRANDSRYQKARRVLDALTELIKNSNDNIMK